MMVGMIVVAVALLSIVLDVTIGSFPCHLFSFPLNILTLILWLILIAYLYGKRKESCLAKFMLSRCATWLSLSIMALIGIVLGLQRTPSSTSWLVVVGLLFVLTHLAFVILRGWRNRSGIRLRFILTHVGLWLALGAGFWGAPDRKQLRVAVDSNATDQAYTMAGAVRDISKADMLIVAGTSLTVYPAAGLVQYYRGNKLVVINKTELPGAGADLTICAPIGEVMSQL